MLAYPAADVPTVQLSLVSSLDPEAHVRIGEALAPLRDEGVLLLASGLSFHNMGAFQRAMGGGGGGGVDSKSKVRQAPAAAALLQRDLPPHKPLFQ
jgi:aromatic ring-opening dioxygenase catalytic subunit (LigB family)